MARWEMGKKKSPVYYMNHYHLIYTPKELEDLKIESLPYGKYCASQEIGQGGRHWHIYIQTDYAFDKIADTLKEVQKIPKGARGKRSLYYSNRFIPEHPPEYPDQDLRKFTLGYTLKNQSVDDGHENMKIKGFSNEELVEAYEYYQTESAKTYKPPEPLQPQVEALPEKDGIQAEWADYLVFIERIVRPQILHSKTEIPIDYIKSQTRKFFRNKSNGLLPQPCKFKRFLASVVDRLRSNINLESRLALMKECGYT